MLNLSMDCSGHLLAVSSTKGMLTIFWQIFDIRAFCSTAGSSAEACNYTLLSLPTKSPFQTFSVLSYGSELPGVLSRSERS